MKRLISAAALAAIMICSCQKAGQDAPFTGETKVTIKVSGGASDLTKTVMERNSADNGYEFFWEEGDEISISEINCGSGTWCMVDSKCKSFEKEFDMSFRKTPEELAVTPMRFIASCPDNAVFYNIPEDEFFVTIPEHQVITDPSSFAPNADVLLSNLIETTGVPKVLNFGFTRIGSIVKINLTDLPASMDVNKIDFEFDSPVSGTAIVNLSDMTMEPSEGYNRITLEGIYNQPFGTTDANGNFTCYLRCYPAEVSRMSILVNDTYERVIDISEHEGASPIVFHEGGMSSFSVDVMLTITDIDIQSEIPTKMNTGDTLAIQALPVPHQADGEVCWKSSDESIICVTEDNVIRAYDQGTATLTAYIGDEDNPIFKKDFTIEVVFGYVDLGLPSGTMWAICNLDAVTPEGFGNYYAFGELETKTRYEKDTYKYYKLGDYQEGQYGLTKYSDRGHGYIESDGRGNLIYYEDNDFTLDIYDDVAHQKLGGLWRIPSSQECQELIDNCTYEWYKLRGVAGTLFTSKINGKSIFLPAAGVVYHDNSLNYEGSEGFYSTMDLKLTDCGDVMVLDIDNEDFTGPTNAVVKLVGWRRFFGYTIRPVKVNVIVY